MPILYSFFESVRQYNRAFFVFIGAVETLFFVIVASLCGRVVWVTLCGGVVWVTLCGEVV